MARRPFDRAGIVLSLLCGCLLCGCLRPSTPEAACESFLRALGEGDAGALFDGLLESTQWAFSTVQKNHRRMRKLIEAGYPRSEQPAAQSRLYGADADSGKELFMKLFPDRYAAAWNARLGTGDPVVRPSAEHPGELLCQRASGAPFRLARAPSRRWGVADLDAEWDQAQLRAVHDLETVSKNAELYKGAAP